MAQVIRQTKEDLDRQILDHAAALFARHGFEHTSIQAVADAVGYSKAGLLYRFASKEVLKAAVLSTALRQLQDIKDRLEALPKGIGKDRAAIEALVGLSRSNPGFTTLMLSAVGHRTDATIAEGFSGFTEAVFALFGESFDPPQALTDDRLLRIGAACGGLMVTTLGAMQEQAPMSELQPRIVNACMNTLGHIETPSTSD